MWFQIVPKEVSTTRLLSSPLHAWLRKKQASPLSREPHGWKGDGDEAQSIPAWLMSALLLFFSFFSVRASDAVLVIRYVELTSGDWSCWPMDPYDSCCRPLWLCCYHLIFSNWLINGFTLNSCSKIWWSVPTAETSRCPPAWLPKKSATCAPDLVLIWVFQSNHAHNHPTT